MIDIEMIRNDLVRIIAQLNTRGQDYHETLHTILKIDQQLRILKTKNQQLQAQNNQASQKIGELINLNQITAANEIKKAMVDFKKTLITDNKLTSELTEQLNNAMLLIPNIPHYSVPLGKAEKDNKEIKKWGKITKKTSKPHWEIAEKLDMIDFTRATKLSGSRFILYKDKGALLVRALLNFMIDLHRKKGYCEFLPPLIVNQDILVGTGQLPKFKEDLFQLKGTEQYLIPTAEVPLTNIYQQEIIDFANLPLKMCAYTPCFRSEAGSAGKDTRGIIRLHQFNKVELVQIVDPAESYQAREELTNDAAAVLSALEIPYRVISLCTGDLGFSASKTYDLELWLPSQNCYREVSSCSNCEAFQARRMKLRARKENNVKIYPHTLNGSGLAIDRVVAAILENFYDEEKAILNIPLVLQPYMNNLKVI